MAAGLAIAGAHVNGLNWSPQRSAGCSGTVVARPRLLAWADILTGNGTAARAAMRPSMPASQAGEILTRPRGGGNRSQQRHALAMNGAEIGRL
ncbi:MAG: hypothetical protein U1E53_04770 [Dongiaceae bacterium]